MQKLLLLLIAFFSLQSFSNAQDLLTRKNGQVLKVKILEVGTSEVRYRNFGDDEGPIYVLEKDRISKIKYETGKEEKLIPDVRDMEQYQGQKTHAIKVNFLSPLSGHTMITYEHSPKLGQSFEASLSIIGAGNNRTLDWYDNTGFQRKKRDQFGVGVGVGYKFVKLPNFQFGKMRYTHIMQGSYAKPSLYVGTFKENVLVYKSTETTIERQSVTFGALQLELGRQWVLGDKFVLDTYGGLGLGIDNRKENAFYDMNGESATSYNYMNARVGYSPSLSFNGGIKLGILF